MTALDSLSLSDVCDSSWRSIRNELVITGCASSIVVLILAMIVMALCLIAQCLNRVRNYLSLKYALCGHSGLFMFLLCLHAKNIPTVHILIPEHH